jgi:hypothetical protein
MTNQAIAVLIVGTAPLVLAALAVYIAAKGSARDAKRRAESQH